MTTVPGRERKGGFRRAAPGSSHLPTARFATNFATGKPLKSRILTHFA